MRTPNALARVALLGFTAQALAARDVCVNSDPAARPLKHPLCLLPPSALSKDLQPMSTQSGRRLRRANPATIQEKLLVGYQGWFQCAGDGPPIHRGHHGWVHWFTEPMNSTKPNKRPNVDLWPDTSGYPEDELYTAPGLHYADGSPVKLFSSRHPRTVRRHFHWMAEHGVDGAFLQRFTTHLEVDGDESGTQVDLMRFRDEVGDRVREAAEAEDRVFAIMYDFSGSKPDRLRRSIEVDWMHLLRDKKILESPNYLHEDGKPVIGLWGVGFEDSGQDPMEIAAIVQFLKSVTPGGAYVMAGTPTHWASLSGDQDADPRWIDVYYDHFDAISPWTVGRYDDIESADEYAMVKIKDDFESIKVNSFGRKIDYVPVVFPGMSAYYLSNKKQPANWAKREGGKFLWRQIYNARRAGARIIYAAMWDEYDEGTALLPIVSSQRSVPVGEEFLALDADGYDLPPDWYMRIVGMAAEGLRNERRIMETFPKKELDDYWARRPHYEEPEPSASSSSNVPQTTSMPDLPEDDEQSEAPPPYSLEADATTPAEPPAPSHTQDVADAQAEAAPSPPVVPPRSEHTPPADTLRRNQTVGNNTQAYAAELRRNQTVASSRYSVPLASGTSSHAAYPTPVQSAPLDVHSLSSDFRRASINPASTGTPMVGGFVDPGLRPSQGVGQHAQRPIEGYNVPASGGYGYQHAGPASPQQAATPPSGPPPAGTGAHFQVPEVPPRRPFPLQQPRPTPMPMPSTGDPSPYAQHAGQQYPYNPYPPQNAMPHPQHAQPAFPVAHPDSTLLPRPAVPPAVPGHDPNLRPHTQGWHPPAATPQHAQPYQYASGYVAHPAVGQQRPQQQQQQQQQQQGAGRFDAAWDVLGRVAGQDTRRQLENIADSGSRIVGRFTGGSTRRPNWARDPHT